MTTPNAIASERQQLWKVDGFAGYFATKDGGDATAAVGKVYDGGSLVAETMSSPAETSDIVLTKPYRPSIHADQVRQLMGQVGRYRTTVSGYDTDPDLGPIGEPITYADALLVGVKRPKHDAASADPGRFELTFAVTSEA